MRGTPTPVSVALNLRAATMRSKVATVMQMLSDPLKPLSVVSQMELPDAPDAVRQARRWVTRQMAGLWHEDVAYVTALLVSELCTNALRAESRQTVCILHNKMGVPLLEVFDDAPGLAITRSPAEDDKCGRGMIVVSGYAKAWGQYSTLTGKCIWVEPLIF